MKNKKINIFLYILSSIFILLGIIGFSFLIPRIDANIHEIELELDYLQFNIFQLHQAQTQGHTDFNLGKILVELNPVESIQKDHLLQDSIDGTKAAIVSAHALKTGEIINKNSQEFLNLYPGKTFNEAKKELDNVLKEPNYFNQKGRELKEQKNIKIYILGWSIFFQILGFILLHILTFYKEYKKN